MRVAPGPVLSPQHEAVLQWLTDHPARGYRACSAELGIPLADVQRWGREERSRRFGKAVAPTPAGPRTREDISALPRPEIERRLREVTRLVAELAALLDFTPDPGGDR